jgi:stalled ribosome rescue protein Dom34
MSQYHAIVWIDHAAAHVMHISPDDVEQSIVRPEGGRPHLHHKRGAIGSGHASENQHYLHDVVASLAGAQEILIVGPGQAKLALIKHAQAHDPAVAVKVVGVETVDHPSDAQLVAYARRYFEARDHIVI